MYTSVSHCFLNMMLFITSQHIVSAQSLPCLQTRRNHSNTTKSVPEDDRSIQQLSCLPVTLAFAPPCLCWHTHQTSAVDTWFGRSGCPGKRTPDLETSWRWRRRCSRSSPQCQIVTKVRVNFAQSRRSSDRSHLLTSGQRNIQSEGTT